MAFKTGGALRLYSSSYSTVTGTIFQHNRAISGGGISTEAQSSLALEDCFLVTNTGFKLGGGLQLITDSTASIRNTDFIQNFATERGAAVASQASSISMQYCSMTSNTALGSGGNAFRQVAASVSFSPAVDDFRNPLS